MNLPNFARNERLKAERRIKQLKKMANSKNFSAAERASFKDEITQLKRAANATRMYTKSGRKIKSRTAEKRQAAVDSLKALNKKYDTLVRTREADPSRNLYIKQQLRLAKIGEESMFTKKQVNIFFASTKSAWQDAPRKYRLEAISKKFKEKDYEKLIEKVLKAYVKKAKAIMGEDLDEETLFEAYEDAVEESDRYNYYGQVLFNEFINAA